MRPVASEFRVELAERGARARVRAQRLPRRVSGADVELRDDAEELGGYVSEAPFSKAAPQSYS